MFGTLLHILIEVSPWLIIAYGCWLIWLKVEDGVGIIRSLFDRSTRTKDQNAPHEDSSPSYDI